MDEYEMNECIFDEHPHEGECINHLTIRERLRTWKNKCVICGKELKADEIKLYVCSTCLIDKNFSIGKDVGEYEGKTQRRERGIKIEDVKKELVEEGDVGWQ